MPCDPFAFPHLSLLLKVRKEWPGQGVFTGCVVRYKHDLFLVRYEDEDEEEMEQRNLRKIVPTLLV